MDIYSSRARATLFIRFSCRQYQQWSYIQSQCKYPGRGESKKRVLRPRHSGLSAYLGYKETNYRTTQQEMLERWERNNNQHSIIKKDKSHKN